MTSQPCFANNCAKLQVMSRIYLKQGVSRKRFSDTFMAFEYDFQINKLLEMRFVRAALQEIITKCVMTV